MALFDYTVDMLETYQPVLTAAGDFDAFWGARLGETRSHPLDVVFEPYDAGLAMHDVFDVTYSGYGGQRIKAWLIMPRSRQGQLPCVVEYIGYGGGRGFPTSWLLQSSAGRAHFIMDTRGQGSVWQKGDTPDIESDPNPQFPGFMTRGVLRPEHHYYVRVYMDAVRAIEAARVHPDVDGRIVVTGGSQGGGITVAMTGLVPDLTGAYASQPFLTNFERAIRLTDALPYAEITNYLKIHLDHVDQVALTLSYIDGMNHAARASAPARFTVGLMDTVCPPSTIYAAYNHYAGQKSMKTWDFNPHDGGGAFGTQDQLRYINDLLS